MISEQQGPNQAEKLATSEKNYPQKNPDLRHIQCVFNNELVIFKSAHGCNISAESVIFLGL